MKLEEKLRRKGWTEADITRAMSIFKDAGSKRSKKSKIFDTLIYMLGLILAMLGNFVVVVFMIPIVLFMQGLILYLTIAVIGIAFGALFNFLIKDIEQLNPKQHIIAGIFIPAIAVISIFILLNLARQFDIGQVISPYLISAIYVVAYLIPYFFFRKEDLFRKN